VDTVHECDRQTDRQTDGQTDGQNYDHKDKDRKTLINVYYNNGVTQNLARCS